MKSQAVIRAIQNNIVKSVSNTELTCIKNPNKLGKDNDVTIAWTPGHTGIQDNEKADILAKSGSVLNVWGLNLLFPFHMLVVALQ